MLYKNGLKEKPLRSRIFFPLFDSNQVHISQLQMELIENIGTVILAQPLSEAQPEKNSLLRRTVLEKRVSGLMRSVCERQTGL